MVAEASRKPGHHDVEPSELGDITTTTAVRGSHRRRRPRSAQGAAPRDAPAPPAPPPAPPLFGEPPPFAVPPVDEPPSPPPVNSTPQALVRTATVSAGHGCARHMNRVTVAHDFGLYLVEDQYCLEPACTCDDVVAQNGYMP